MNHQDNKFLYTNVADGWINTRYVVRVKPISETGLFIEGLKIEVSRGNFTSLVTVTDRQAIDEWAEFLSGGKKG